MSETIASRMHNRYGPALSSRAAERMQSAGPVYAKVAESANARTEGLPEDFAHLRTTESANRRTARSKPPGSEAADSRTARTEEGAGSISAECGHLPFAEEPPAATPRAASRSASRSTSHAPLLMCSAGSAFSMQPIEALFDEDVVRDSLADAARVAEVALESAMRAVRRAQASGDPRQIEEAELVLERLRRALG